MLASGGGTVDHVNGAHFALDLHNGHARGGPRAFGHQGLEDFALGCYGVAEIGVGTVAYGGES